MSLDEEIMEVCEKIFDISANHKLTYDEILEKIKKQIDYEVFMASPEY